MKYLLTCLAGLLALGFVAVTPDAASAGYRSWGWGGGWGPGFGIYVGPRYGYGYRPYYRDRYSYGYGYGYPWWRNRYHHYDRYWD
jgi:hypothetical protein